MLQNILSQKMGLKKTLNFMQLSDDALSLKSVEKENS